MRESRAERLQPFQTTRQAATPQQQAEASFYAGGTPSQPGMQSFQGTYPTFAASVQQQAPSQVPLSSAFLQQPAAGFGPPLPAVAPPTFTLQAGKLYVPAHNPADPV